MGVGEGKADMFVQVIQGHVSDAARVRAQLHRRTPGDPSRAGFVQVMQGRSSDSERARELRANDPADGTSTAGRRKAEAEDPWGGYSHPTAG